MMIRFTHTMQMPCAKFVGSAKNKIFTCSETHGME